MNSNTEKPKFFVAKTENRSKLGITPCDNETLTQ